MKVIFTVQCPSCNFVYTMNLEDSPKGPYLYSSCRKCGRKIKIKSSTSKYEVKDQRSARSTDPIKTLGQVKGLGIEPSYQAPEAKSNSDKIMEIEKTGEFNQDPIEVFVESSKPNLILNKKSKYKQSPFQSQSKQTTKLQEIEPLSSDYQKPAKPKKNFFLSDPSKRLNLAFFLLILVFILGLFHGINSVILGTPDQIFGDVEKPETSDVLGKIIDNKTGDPIANCKVRILKSNQYTETNSDGQYYIPDVKAGDHKIQAEAEGYIKIIKKVTVDPELMGFINFELDEGIGINTVDESVDIRTTKKDDSINIFAVLIIIFAIFGLLAALLVRGRIFFHLCTIMAFIGIGSLGFGMGIILGIIAFILIILSNQGFKKRFKNTIPSIKPDA